MSKWEKLLNDIKNMSSDIRFDELEKVLNYYGYKSTFPKSGSSHCVFRKEKEENIIIPVHRTIKRVYVEQVKKVIEKEENK